ncbi:MAG: carboxypeptidase regulatory-like domain-containing protein, partial [Bacteroidales bacterium]|nr:carboxypeptidase regulatory-like domain-containing protein [Bacteroidales bacterium]
KEQWNLAIIASKDGYLNKTHILNQNTGDMGKTIPLNFIMETYGITISGRVTDFYGHPISNASILDWVDYDGYSEWELVSTTQTNSNGEYQLVVPSTYIIKEGNVTRNCRYHTFKCKYADYPTQSQKLYTADSDNGKSYTFNFTLKYEWEF